MMNPDALFLLVVIGAAVLGGFAFVILAGPAGLTVGTALLTVAYFSLGAVVGATIGAGMMLGMGFGMGPGGRGGGVAGSKGEGKNSWTLSVEKQEHSLAFSLSCGAGEVLRCDYDPNLAGKSLPQVAGNVRDKICAQTSPDTAPPVLEVSFTECPHVLKDMVIQELRQQGLRVSRQEKEGGA